MRVDRIRRIGLKLLKIAGIAVALLAVAVGGIFVALKTDWGGERLRRQIVKRANQQILGQLGIGKLSFRGDGIRLRDITLRDPDGELVARISGADMAFRIAPLLHKEVRITSFKIDEPVVSAVSDEQGLNLARATAPRTKTPEKKKPAPKTNEEGWVIRLERFDLSGGDVRMINSRGAVRKDVVHLANLTVFVTVRYATGNGSLDLVLRTNAQNTSAPAGPISLLADARIRGSAIHFSVDATLLTGSIKGHGDLDADHLANSDAVVVAAIPRQAIAGFDWGPLHLDLQARPNTVPTVDFRLAVPGLELTANGGKDKTQPADTFQFAARLALADLALTAKGLQAFSPSELPALGGEGRLDVTGGGPMSRAPAGWNAALKGRFPRMRLTETTISDLEIDGHTADFSAVPRDADLHVGAASITSGTTVLRKLQLAARLQQQTVSLHAGMASPQPIELALAGRVDDDRAGLALTQMTLHYPRAEWTSEGTARFRSEPERVSLSGLRLHSDTQRLSVDGSKAGEQFDLHLALNNLRLDLLPVIVVNPDLKLGGTLDLDVKGAGRSSNPKVDAQVRVTDGRVRNISMIEASVDASLADQRVNGKLAAQASMAALTAHFGLPIDPLKPRGALDLGLDVSRLDLSDALRAAAMKPQVDGRLTVHLGITGSADDPKADLVLTARELTVKRVQKRAPRAAANNAVDVGHGRLHLSYAERAARGDVDFSFSQGGTLHVESIARVDISYPRITQGVVVKKMPIHGKVRAHDLDVAWISQFNEQMQTLGGQVSADAQLGGTVGDPQFIGDVRWKNGKVVTVAAPKPVATSPHQ